jgi:microcystin-dependent protein
MSKITDFHDAMVGMVFTFTRNTVPYGFLLLDGSVLNQADYPALFSVMGTLYNTGGELSSQFRLPDCRGQFIRGHDQGAGVDAGRVFGSQQGDAFASHSHGATGATNFANGGGAGAFQTAGNTWQTGTAGGTETRPKNVAFLVCVKY